MDSKTAQDYVKELMSYAGSNPSMLKVKEALPRIQHSILDLYYTHYEDDSGKYRLWRCNINDPNGDLIWEECYERKNRNQITH